MSDAILCPQVGQDLTEAKVVALHVKLGDTVKRGQIVAEVESEKATFEVEAFSSGIVVELPYEVGATATVLEPLVVLGSGTEVAPKPATANGAAAAQAASPQAKHRPEAATLVPRPAAPGAARSSPLARRMARGNSLDIESIAGTGPYGAVVMRDVEGIIARSATAAVRPAATAGSALNVKSLRDGTGTPVVFLHGFGADISAWRQIAMAIALPNSLFAVDLPGHGASPDARGGFQAAVEDVAATLRVLGKEFHLVGHSLGAAVAIGLTAQTGLNIKSLTLFAPAGLGPTVDGGFIAAYLAAKSEAALAAQMQRLVGDPSSLPASIVKATQAARAAGPVTDRQDKLAGELFEGSTQLFSVRSELANYAGPCRIIVGLRDHIIPPAETERGLPAGAALHRFESAGHLPFLEQQSLAARLLAETVRSGG